MTVMLYSSRTLSKYQLYRPNQTLTRLITNKAIKRVAFHHTNALGQLKSSLSIPHGSSILKHSRNFATASKPKAVGRPKAHTGRSKVSTRKAGSKKPGPKPKAKAKPKKKKAIKPKAKKQPSEASKKRLAAQERTLWRKQSLLNKQPKKLPQTAWNVLFIENAPEKGGQFGSTGSAIKAAAEKYKNLSPEEHERLNHIANQNKEKNDAAYKKWVESHTPTEIKDANTARSKLQAYMKTQGKKVQYSPIQDERLVKRPMTAWTLFVKARHASGDLKGMTVKDYAQLVAREWKELSASEKKTYEDQAAGEQSRYVTEYKSAYGTEPPSRRSSKSQSP